MDYLYPRDHIEDEEEILLCSKNNANKQQLCTNNSNSRCCSKATHNSQRIAEEKTKICPASFVMDNDYSRYGHEGYLMRVGKVYLPMPSQHQRKQIMAGKNASSDIP